MNLVNATINYFIVKAASDLHLPLPLLLSPPALLSCPWDEHFVKFVIGSVAQR
jgi:hypothetical protein